MITDDICHDDIETLCLTASPQTTERRAALKSSYFGRFQNSFCCQSSWFCFENYFSCPLSHLLLSFFCQYQGTFYFCIDMNIVKKIVNFNVKNLIRFFPRTSGKTKQKENFIRTFKIYRKDDILFRRGRYQISNVLGSSGDSGSKKKYWERHSKLKFSFCLVEKCRNRATVGGHVWIKEFPWKKSKAAIYIIPLCQVTVFHC